MVMHAINFHNETKRELETMLSIQSDLNRARSALDILHREYGTHSEAMAALYTQFLVSYVRSFASGRRQGLRQEIFTDVELLAVHKELKGVRDQHVAHPVSDHELCVVLAVVPDLSRNELVGFGVKYWFFVADTPEKLAVYRKPLEFALAYVNAEVEKLGNQLAKDLLGEGQTWKSAQAAFWSVLSPEEVFGPGADDAMSGGKN
jgi:hypothetical protein